MYWCFVPGDGGRLAVFCRGRQGTGDEAARLSDERGAHGGHLLSVHQVREAKNDERQHGYSLTEERDTCGRDGVALEQ